MWLLKKNFRHAEKISLIKISMSIFFETQLEMVLCLIFLAMKKTFRNQTLILKGHLYNKLLMFLTLAVKFHDARTSKVF